MKIPMPSMRSRLIAVHVTLAVVVASMGFGARAQGVTTLYTFSGCPDGDHPASASLVLQNAILYGTTPMGGSCKADAGTVFQLKIKAGVEKVLYRFKGKADGKLPYAGVTPASGKLFGTTMQGGDFQHGNVFMLDPATGIETNLYSFKSTPDADSPEGPLILVNGALYGTTYFGGTNGFGAIIKVDPATGKVSVPYSFQAAGDGIFPSAGLTEHAGILYGTTVEGGPHDEGTVFAFDPVSGGESVLYAFLDKPDARRPHFGVTYLKGHLYGATAIGGIADQGALFSITISAGAETVLYSFSGGADGGTPETTLAVQGNLLYGTTTFGGQAGEGTIFEIDPRTAAEIVVHDFGGSDGANPQTGLLDNHGVFYGTTSDSQTGQGTIFAFTPQGTHAGTTK